MRLLNPKLAVVIVTIITTQNTSGQNLTLTRYPYIQKPSINSVLVAWQTDKASNGIVEYGPTMSLGSQAVDTSIVTLHGLEIVNLEPNTTYYYRVASGGEVLSEIERFHTNHDTLHPAFDFLIFGDMGDGGPAQINLRNRILNLDFDLAILPGDIVYDSGEWKNFDPRHFAVYKNIISNTAFFPALGNHDIETEDGLPYLTNFFLPRNNADSLEHYYSFDYGKTHFICLDLTAAQLQRHSVPFDTMSNQYSWLESDLRSASTWADFIIPFFHHPPFSSSRSYESIQDAIVPLFEKYDVEIVFTAHDHFYERWLPINGVTYVITGGGGRELDTPRPNAGVAYGEQAFHVTLASVQGKTLSYQMVRTDGTVGDSTRVVSSTQIQPLAVLEAHSSHSISATAPFEADRNHNGTAFLAHKLSSEVVWMFESSMGKNSNEFSAELLNLTPNTRYDVQVWFSDPDGVAGDSIQIIENILTTPFFTVADTVFVNFAQSSILVIAEFFGDGNNNLTALLEHKLSSASDWTVDGSMIRDSLAATFTFPIEGTTADNSYDFRITFSDPDGVQGENPLVKSGAMNILASHSGIIVVDGKLDDWRGVSPHDSDTWVNDGIANEFIWKDAQGDDLGDGGDAPNASDNPESYAYPLISSYVGVEADIEEFRVAYDQENLYFLLDLVDGAKDYFPFSIILLDKDGAVAGSRTVGSSSEVELGPEHAWDYKIELFNRNLRVTDDQGVDISVGSDVEQNISENYFEVSVPISVLGLPESDWSFAVLQSISSNLNGVFEIDFSSSFSRGGGGIDGFTDPDIYDLIGASRENQLADLAHYTDSTHTVLTSSWLKIPFPEGISTRVDDGAEGFQNTQPTFQLYQNYPNPFNPETTISYRLETSEHLNLSIYNVLGQKTKTLLDDLVGPGFHEVAWDGRNDVGQQVASGLYFYQIASNNFVLTRKLLLLR